MKTETRGTYTEFLSNSITRNLIIIFVGTMVTAISLVTAIFLVYDQW